METFLEKVVDDIVSNQTVLKKAVCVIPSERAGVNLRNAFKNRLHGNPTFLPRIISIENFINEISGFESMSQVALLFEFYHVYKSNCKDQKIDSFERFIGWATIAIQDFNEIDRHLVNATEIFNYLSDLQNIKDWAENKEEETATVKNYLNFIKDLDVYYKAFTKVLTKKKIAYQGLIYREAYQKVSLYHQKNKDKIFHFIGFNALNKAEEGIFKTFLNDVKNKIYWDVDSYYFQGNHEAGTFLRTFFNNWECLNIQERKNWVQSCFQEKKNIQILGAPLNVTGIKTATSFLKNEVNPNQTAMVLAEESLLPVVLNSIPSNVQNVNITMGYPLNNIPMYGLFQSLFKMQLNKQKLGKNALYYKDILSLLRHPYFAKIEHDASQKLIRFITKSNKVFVSDQELVQLLEEHKFNKASIQLFNFQDGVMAFLFNVMNFISFLESFLKGIDILYLESFKKVFQELIQLNNQYQYIHNFKVLTKVFYKLISLETVDFKGDALEGLQLMGVLESRCLDFKNVIITSVNEGVLPSGKTESSFISFDVKKQFDMPTYLAKDAIFSYHFYRLLQRAENIYLLYNTQMDDFGGGEMSRFLTRLLIDKESEILHKKVTTKVISTLVEPVEVKKTQAVQKILLDYFQKGVSPSRVNDYINDPIEFYQKMILKIRETEKVEEEVAENTLGTIVHDSLEFLYTPYLGRILTKEDIHQMKIQADVMVNDKFKEYFKLGDISTGKNKLISEVAKQFVTNFLNLDLEQINRGKNIVVKELERECKVDLTTPKGSKIRLKGKIDRVDEVDGILRIVDYKTGKVEASDLKLGDVSLATSDYKYHKILQVLFYVIIYAFEEQIDWTKCNLQTGIYSFKNLKSGFLAMNFSENNYKKEYKVTEENLNLFKDSLLQLIDEILDNKLNFVENTDRNFKKEA
ncbi:PD-(D/E)XK nuclease family protein [Ochrovirga pacifica]|uniref:PD-(D/E)XK nuclease family protein n=1 Tax=Ochrovirga pacifica TaxID=1042376 RepID=UPI0002558355|nr:PD-(D/E)XK nuclease family protein [Ochrovirga pacifica]